MNKFFLSGRLTADPKMEKTQTGIDYCDFSLAVNRPHTKKDAPPDFFNCRIWGTQDGPGRAETIYKYCHKGDGLSIVGVMETNRYQDKDTGKSMTSYRVKVDDFEFPLSRKQDGQQTAQPTAPAEPAGGGFVEVDSSEPLPF